MSLLKNDDARGQAPSAAGPRPGCAQRSNWEYSTGGNGEYSSGGDTIESIAGKIGCTAETLRKWVRQGERDSGVRPGATTTEQQRIKDLEREVRELRKTNEILKLASAYFAQAELDRHHRK